MTNIKQVKQTPDPEMDALYRVYQEIRKVMAEWQEERGGDWVKTLIPKESYPYFPLSSLPEEPVLELAGRLLKAQGGNESRGEEKRAGDEHESLRSAWNRFVKGEWPDDPELYSRLNLAANGVLDLARKTLPEAVLETAKQEKSRFCPVCGQEAGLSLLVSPVGKRYLHCMSCGHEWIGKRVGCIRCGSEEASEQTYLQSEDFPGVEIVVCQSCGETFKEVDLRKRSVEDFMWEDIRTLPLNYAVEKWMAEQAEEKKSLH